MEDNKSLIFAGALIAGLAVIAGLAFLVFQMNSSEESEDTQEQQEEVAVENNIVETAQATDSLSTLVDAVVAAELVDTLSDENSEFTVFAPTNAAFGEIEDTVNTLLQPENQSDLQNVLQYHVVSGKVMSSDLQNGQMVETLAGDMIKIRIAGGNVYINDAMVSTADVNTTNGVVHIIDKVMVPGAFNNAVGVAQSNDALSTLVAAVTAGDLVETLSASDATYTIFAPTNTAFSDIQSTVDTLLQPENKDDLVGVLTYHVVDSEVFSSELSDGQEITTLSGETLTVEIENGSVYIVANNSRAMVSTADVISSNAIIHVVDAVLVP